MTARVRTLYLVRKSAEPLGRRAWRAARVSYLTLVASLAILCLVTATLSLAMTLLGP